MGEGVGLPLVVKNASGTMLGKVPEPPLNIADGHHVLTESFGGTLGGHIEPVTDEGFNRGSLVPLIGTTKGLNIEEGDRVKVRGRATAGTGSGLPFREPVKPDQAHTTKALDEVLPHDFPIRMRSGTGPNGERDRKGETIKLRELDRPEKEIIATRRRQGPSLTLGTPTRGACVTCGHKRFDAGGHQR
jgi:hypothetical protein